MYVVTLSEIEKMEKDIIGEGFVPSIQELIHRIKMQDLGNGDDVKAREKIESSVDQAVEENQFKNLQ